MNQEETFEEKIKRIINLQEELLDLRKRIADAYKDASGWEREAETIENALNYWKKDIKKIGVNLYSPEDEKEEADN